ncbi:MAG: hypothetical protein IJD95_06005 [Clostridia bacterium]|nr:hypothetical protein [Clostridia bacterium]
MEGRNELIEYFKAYPELEIRDIFKFLFQSVFGCEHIAPSERSVVAKIEEEATSFSGNGDKEVTSLIGDYSRISLSVLNTGITPQTLGRLVCLSAKHGKKGSEDELEKRLFEVKELILSGKLPFEINEFEEQAEKWRESGFAPLHHSDLYREKYKPAYRLASNAYIPFLPLFARLDTLLSNGRVILAIEGGSASGKTTLASLLKELYGAAVFHADDYFLQLHQRTKERLAETGGNLDRERLKEEILIPLSQNGEVRFRRYDCQSGRLLAPKSVTTAPLTVIEGAYSMHPELREFYDLTVFLDIDKELQKARVTARNGEMAHRFFDEWIPLEDSYFEELDIKKKADIIIKIGE